MKNYLLNSDNTFVLFLCRIENFPQWDNSVEVPILYFAKFSEKKPKELEKMAHLWTISLKPRAALSVGRGALALSLQVVPKTTWNQYWSITFLTNKTGSSSDTLLTALYVTVIKPYRPLCGSCQGLQPLGIPIFTTGFLIWSILLLVYNVKVIANAQLVK